TLLTLAGASDSFWASLVLLGAGALAADQPPPRETPAPPASAAPSQRDLELTVKARKAMAQDEDLARAGLSVRVRQGVAVLGGAVPSAELLKRAVKKVEQVKGVLEVRSELRVAAPAPAPLFTAPPDEEPTRTVAASPPREAPLTGVLANRAPRPDEPPA